MKLPKLKLIPNYGEALCCCKSCGNNLIFPEDRNGEHITCPLCNKPTVLKAPRRKLVVPRTEHPQQPFKPRAQDRAVEEPSAVVYTGTSSTGSDEGIFSIASKWLMPVVGVICLILAPFTCGMSMIAWVAMSASFGVAKGISEKK